MYTVKITKRNGEIPQYISFYCEDYALLDCAAISDMLIYLWLQE